jgi:hypothetical protein
MIVLGWMFPAEGALVPASKIFSRILSGTFLSLSKFLTEVLAIITSSTLGLSINNLPLDIVLSILE